MDADGSTSEASDGSMDGSEPSDGAEPFEDGSVTAPDAAMDSATPQDAGTDAASDPGAAARTIPPGCEAALDLTVATHFYDAVKCLFESPTALQVGVEPGALEPARIAVLRGRVRDRTGDGLSDVTVTLLRDDRVGATVTRSDGLYDMAVPGGGTLTLRFEKPGYLPAQRRASVGWQQMAALPDVVLTQRAAAPTTVALGELIEPAFVRGSASSDESGTRRQTLLVRPGTSALLVREDGSTEPVGEINVRIAEYTVGSDGPAAMPGNLPPTSAYTYAVELSIDEALGDGVEGVQFDPPIVGYVDNFLAFPAGTIVPLGYFDGRRDIWEAADSGVVLDVLGIDGALIQLDSDGDGEPDDAVRLAMLGISDAERMRLATEYGPGDSLWRIEVPHFSPWDCNWPFGPPGDAAPPLPDIDEGEPDDCSAEESGSIIGCEDQTLGEVLALEGTPYRLHYQSEHARGRGAERTIEIHPAAGGPIPASVKRIEIEVDVLGTKTTASLPAEPNARYLYEWDGRDAWDRAWQGRQQASVRVGYVYDGAYEGALRFGEIGDGIPVTGDRSREEITLWNEWHGKLGGFDRSGSGLGGWSLDAQHVYDARGGTLWLGSGERRTAERIGNEIETVAGTGTSGFLGDGGPATQARIASPHGIVVAPDGTVFLSDEGTHRVRAILPDGTITTYAGTGTSSDTGDGGPALAATISRPLGLALASDGRLYIAGRGGLIRVIDPVTGTIETAAGGGTPVDGRGDGGPATSARFLEPHALAFAPDGSLLVVDALEHTLRRIGPDGLISTIAGTPGVASSLGDGGPALTATLSSPLGLAIAENGTIYISEADGDRIRRIDSTGTISTFAGTGTAGFQGDGGPAIEARLNAPHSVAVGADGTVYVTDEGNDRVRRIRTDGVIETIAGGGMELGTGDRPLDARFRLPRVVYHHSDGTVWIADYDDQRVRRITPGLPGFSTTDVVVASSDASELYVFDDHGKHLRTLDAILGVVTTAFDYDDNGLVIAITDRDGNQTSIERRGDGTPEAIVGPYGARTEVTLDEHGYLETLVNPALETTELTHTEDGLLVRLERPRSSGSGDVHVFEYDDAGRLVRDEGPTGLVQTLVRSSSAEHSEVTLYKNGGRAQSYAVDESTEGQVTRVRTDSAGMATTTVRRDDGWTVTTPTLSESVALKGDPRFGMQASMHGEYSRQYGSLVRMDTTTDRQVVLTDPNNPLSMTSLTETITVNDRVSTRSWDAATRTWTTETPAMRQHTVTLDERGRPVRAQLGDLAPESFIYDDRGRVTSSAVGERAFDFEYDSSGFIAAVVDPLSQRTELTNDAIGRVVALTYEDGSVIDMTYDGASSMTSITPPGRDEHTFTFGPGGLLERYAPATIAGTSGSPTDFAYSAFEDLVSVSYPTGETALYVYDSVSGRLTSIELPDESIGFSYDATTGQLAGMTRGANALAFTYDGALLRRVAWSGEVEDTIDFNYDDDLQISSERVNTTTVMAYDDDGMLIAAGDLVLGRDTATGLLTSTTLETVAETYGYNDFGETIGFHAETASVMLYDRADARDDLGRVVERSEAVLTDAAELAYVYDVRGRLVEVLRDGELSATYEYDDNGNRTSVTTSAGTTVASYDEQDRLVTYGAHRYTFDERGRLIEKETGDDAVAFGYDALGVLRSVTLSDGREVEYVLDPLGRRIGKKVDGVMQRGWIYRDLLAPAAELGPTGALSARFIYGDRANVPEYLVRGSVTYKLICDELGSVRLVVNAVTGEVVQRLDYDEFGVVVADTNPGFQPFGFAGGLYDPDTALVRFGARDYDAEVGRWTSKDPRLFGGRSTNVYAYAGNDPINAFDSDGGALLSQFCEALLERIRNVEHEIEKRTGELHEDPLGLPEACDGDEKKPSLSKRGHRRLLNMHKVNLAALKAMYLARCGPPPGGMPSGGGNDVFDWEYWEELTGLSGTALLIYLILSEGSRLFPPRNAIPLP